MAQLVARYLGVVEAASSSLVTQTRKSQMKVVFVWLFLICTISFELVSENAPCAAGAEGWTGVPRSELVEL